MKLKEHILIAAVLVLKTLSDMLENATSIGKSQNQLKGSLGKTNHHRVPTVALGLDERHWIAVRKALNT